MRTTIFLAIAVTAALGMADFKPALAEFKDAQSVAHTRSVCADDGPLVRLSSSADIDAYLAVCDK